MLLTLPPLMVRESPPFLDPRSSSAPLLMERDPYCPRVMYCRGEERRALRPGGAVLLARAETVRDEHRGADGERERVGDEADHRGVGELGEPPAPRRTRPRRACPRPGRRIEVGWRRDCRPGSLFPSLGVPLHDRDEKGRGSKAAAPELEPCAHDKAAGVGPASPCAGCAVSNEGMTEIGRRFAANESQPS